MIELVTAMTILSVGIMAVVAGFSSGAKALERSRDASSAAAVAESKMEEYRAQPFDGIPTPTCVGAVCSPETVTPVPDGAPVAAADGRMYRLHVVVRWVCPVGTLGPPAASSPDPTCVPDPSAYAVKSVAMTVKDAENARTLFTQTSTFSLLTG